MRRGSFLFPPLTLAALILCAKAPAWAAEPMAASKAVATQLFEDAKALSKNGDLASACAKFAESQRLDAQLGTLLRLAACYEKIGKTASAWVSFKDAVEIASQRHDSREAAARAKVEKLEPRLSKLTITVDAGAPPDLELSSNGSPIGSASLGSPMPIDPGDYLLMARAEGFEDWVRKVAIAHGTPDTQIAVPALVRRPPLAPTPEITSSQQASPLTPVMPLQAGTVQQAQLAQLPEPSDPGRHRRMVGYALGAVGAVGIGFGIGFALAMESKQSDRDSANACSKTYSCTTVDKSKIDQLTNEARTRATLANIGFVSGGVALAAGAVLVVTGWPRSRPSASAQVQPWIGDRAAGFVVGGVW